MTKLGEPYGDQGDQRGCPKREGGPKLIRFESPRWRPKSSSSPSRPLGPVCLKLVTQDASGLRLRRYTYGWKANLIRKPTQVVSHQKPFRINGNRRNNSASRIYQGAATPSFGLLDHVSCLGSLGARPEVLNDPRVFINSRHSSIRVWVLLRLFCQEQFRRSLVCETPTS